MDKGAVQLCLGPKAFFYKKALGKKGPRPKAFFLQKKALGKKVLRAKAFSKTRFFLAKMRPFTSTEIRGLRKPPKAVGLFIPEMRPPSMALSKEVKDRIELYAKAGKSENYILEKIKNDEKQIDAEELEEAVHDAIGKWRKKNVSSIELLASPVLIIGIVILIAVGVLFFFVNNSEFVGKDCTGGMQTVKIKGSLEVRGQIVEALQALNIKDCNAFAYVAENTPSIEVSNLGLPTDPRLITPTYADLYAVAPDQNLWMTRLLLEACLKESQSNTAKECVDFATQTVMDFNASK